MLLFTLLIFSVFIFVLGPYLLKLGTRIVKVHNPTFKKALLVHLLIFLASCLLFILSQWLPLDPRSLLGMVLLLAVGSVVEIFIIARQLKTPLVKSLGIYAVFLAGSVVISLLVTTFLVRSFSLPAVAESMSPALMPGDHVLVNKMAYCFSQPERGDIIAFRSPVKPNAYRAKRVIALSGEIVEIKYNTLLIDGKPMAEPYLHEDIKAALKGYEYFGPITVPEDACFVLGDNRENSIDSRHYGCVNNGLIVGIVSSIYWSLDYQGGGIRWNRLGDSPR